MRIVREKRDLPALIEAPTGEILSFEALRLEALLLAETELTDASHSAVAFCLPNSREWLRVFLALQAVGSAALPLDASTPVGIRRQRAREAGASFLWEGGKLLKLRLRKKSMPGIACIKTTSGSAGKIQPLACQSRHLLADGRNIIATMGIRLKDINLGLVPFSHSYGLGNLIMPLILQGNPIVFSSAYVPSQILQWIPRYGATVFPSVPAVFHALANLSGRESLKPLRLAISAGAPLNAETARRFVSRFGRRIHNLYGASETGSICYDRSGLASLSGRSVGKPLENVQIRILEDGRIQVKSRAVVFPGGRHVLPDFGEWTKAGELRLIGRANASANIGGRKVHPAEIEKHLCLMPGVREARVMVIRKTRDVLLACVETDLTRQAILDHLAKVLPEWKIPRRWFLAAALPRNARGKIDREKLGGQGFL